MVLVAPRGGVLAALLLLLSVSQTTSFSSNVLRVQRVASHNKDTTASRSGENRKSPCIANNGKLGRALHPPPEDVTSSRLWVRTARAECSNEDRLQSDGNFVNIAAVRATFSPKNRRPSSLFDRAMGTGLTKNATLQRSIENSSEMVIRTARLWPRTTTTAKENCEQLQSASSANNSAASTPHNNLLGLVSSKKEHNNDIWQSPAASKAPSPLPLPPSDPIARFSDKAGTTKPSKMATPAIATATIGPLSSSGSVPSLVGRFAAELRTWAITTGGIEQEHEQHHHSNRVTHGVGINYQQAGLSELCSAIARVETKLSKESSESRQLRVSEQKFRVLYVPCP